MRPQHVRAALTRRHWFLASTALLLLAACSSDPVPRDAFYRLGGAAAVAPRAGGPIRGGLEIPPLRAAGIVNERAILYRDSPTRLEQYSYHAWIEPPAALVQRALIDVLRQNQAFERIVSPDMRLDRDYELGGDLRRWEHVRGENAAAIEIEISIRRIRGNQQVLLKTYSANVPAQGESIDAVVAAFTRGMYSISAALMADIALLPGTAPAPERTP